MPVPRHTLGGMTDLLGIPPTHLPEDPASGLIDADDLAPTAIAAANPASSFAWAVLAEAALVDSEPVQAYAYARTGYHRGLDALRRAGWRGQGPIPWEHEPNRGFLRALAALAAAAGAIGERDEEQRCDDFLRQSSAEAAQQLRP